VKAVVLVGGEGTRLRPLTLTTPKPLLPIANRPFLERQLDWLAGHGVDEVVLSLGYLPDAFRAHFPEGRHGDVRLRYAVEERPLGTAGGIRFAAEGIEERFVVCNGDVLTALDLRAVVEFHAERSAEATIALTQVGNPSDFGVVPTRPDGSVRAFVEKPPPGTAPTNWINAGTYVLEPSVLERIPPRLPVSIERETFPRMLEEMAPLFAVHSSAYWLDIGTPFKYLEANGDVLSGAFGDGPPDAFQRAPGIWVDPQADVAAGAALSAPVLVGAGARIEDGASVASSVLGADVVAETGSRIERSVVHAKARVAEDARVVQSVVGAGALVEHGAAVIDGSLVGAGATVPADTRLAGGRVPNPVDAIPTR
jgi:NDP-sugar pyrophosphorylase family protein